jgi:STAND-like protein
MVLDTNYNLNIHLQRIIEKMDRFPSEEPVSSGMDLKDERTVIEHCIRICEEAMSHISTLDDRERQLCSDALSEQATSEAASFQPKLLQVHQETRQVLQGSRDNIAMFLGRLQERLWSLTSDGHPEMERERMQLKEDINALEDSLKVCEIASGEVSRQKIHSFGEIVAEGESDQVVVTTWAELFTVEKATSTGNSAQLIGSMTGNELIQLSRDRYGSRFGAVDSPRVDVAMPSQSKEPRESGVRSDEQQSAKFSRANPNETRKRTTDGHPRS